MQEYWGVADSEKVVVRVNNKKKSGKTKKSV